MRPTQILMDEHRVIEVVLSCLEKIVAESAANNKLNELSANQAIDVIRNFADRCHHGKEENHLFTTLVSKGMPSQGGPVGQMLFEHTQGREFVQGMAESIAGASAGNDTALNQFARNANGYVQLLRAHIGKEDNVLFPMADRILTSDEQDQMLKAFHTVESVDMGKGTHEKYIGIVKSLATQYGVVADHLPAGSCGCGH